MIRSILKTLYWNQWLALALFFVVGDFASNWNLDIAVDEDTYFLLTDHAIGFWVGGFFLITWSLFRFVHMFRSLRWLARIHVTGTTIITILIFLLLSNLVQESQPRRYSDYSVYTEFNKPQTFDVDWLQVLLYAFLVLQLSWFVQLIAWYYYKVRKDKSIISPVGTKYLRQQHPIGICPIGARQTCYIVSHPHGAEIKRTYRCYHITSLRDDMADNNLFGKGKNQRR